MHWILIVIAYSAKLKLFQVWEELWEAAVAIWEKWLTVMVHRHSTNGFSWTETYERR